MEILKTPLSKQSTPIPRGLVWTFILISFLGFLDATFLTAEHYVGAFLGCPIFGGCDQVLTSPYAVLLSVPVALAGAIYYLAIFILGVVYFDTGRARILRFTANLTPLGLIASLWFLYLQLFVIKAICFYCVVSLAISTLLFILGFVFLRKFRDFPA